jgi:hypothetical protein
MASPVARTTEDHAAIESVFLDPSVLSNPFGQKLARRLRKQAVQECDCRSRSYRDLTLAAEPQGIGAVVRQQWTEMASLKAVTESLWLAVESIESPGNLGMILRTSEASGVAGFSSLVRNAALRSRCCEGEYGLAVLTDDDPVPVLGERGMMGNLLIEAEACEPPPRQMHAQLFHQFALAGDAVQIANQQHAQQEFRINRGPTGPDHGRYRKDEATTDEWP